MRKNKQDSTQYSLHWDDSSYHTGPAKPPKRSNGLVAVLLVAVIFLGGMASAMGIINFRLISMMNQRSDPMTPLSSSIPTTQNLAPFLRNHEAPVPTVPQDGAVQLLLEDAAASLSSQEIYSHNLQALVSVYCTTGSNDTLSGTGVVLSEDGYILTNAHIVEAATRIFVVLPDGQLLRAAAVGTDPLTDLAVLYIQAQDLTPALFAQADTLESQETVYALFAQPDEVKNRVLAGNVFSLETLFNCDMSVQVLRSSLDGITGPVFNGNGQIVAVQAGKIRQYFSQSACGEDGLAIPTDMLQAVVNDLIENGSIAGRPILGIQVAAISKLYQQYWDLPGGLLVTILDENCSASLQGLEDGDILLTLDGEQLTAQSDLYTALYQAHVGDELIAAVFRDGRTFTVTLTVEENTQN